MPKHSFSKHSERDTKRIAELTGCECILLPFDLTARQITDLYIREYSEGLKNEYTPVILSLHKELCGSIEQNYRQHGGRDGFRDTMLSEGSADSEEIFNKLYEENGLDEYDDNDEDDKESDFNSFTGVPMACFGFLTPDDHADYDNCLIKIPTDKPWEIFAWLPFGGWNACPYSSDMISVSRHWHEKYGAVPAAVTEDTLQFYLPKPVTEREEAMRLADEQYIVCQDIVDQGTGSVGSLAASLIDSSIWFFWWD